MSKKYNLAYRLLGEGFSKFSISYPEGLSGKDLQDAIERLGDDIVVRDFTDMSKEKIVDMLEDVIIRNKFNDEQSKQVWALAKWLNTSGADGNKIVEIFDQIQPGDIPFIASLENISNFEGFPAGAFWDKLINVRPPSAQAIGAAELALCLMVKDSRQGDDSSKGSELAITSDVVTATQNCNPKIGPTAQGSNDGTEVAKLYRKQWLTARKKLPALIKLFGKSGNDWPNTTIKRGKYGALGQNTLEYDKLKDQVKAKYPDARDINGIVKEIIACSIHCASLAQSKEFMMKGKKTESYLLCGLTARDAKMKKVEADNYSSLVVVGIQKQGRYTVAPWENASNKMVQIISEFTNDGSIANLNAVFSNLNALEQTLDKNQEIKSDPQLIEPEAPGTEVQSDGKVFKKPLIEALGLK